MTPLKLLTMLGCSLSTTIAWAAPTAEPSGTPSPTPPEVSVATTPAPETPAPVTPAPVSPAPSTEPAVAAAPAPKSAAVAPNSAVEPSPYGPVTAQPAKPLDETPEPVDENAPATLWDKNYDYAFGGMGSVGVMYSRFGGKNAALVCGEGAVIIDHALTLGGGGCGITRMLKAEDYATGEYDSDDRMTFGYGGAIGRYHFLSRKLVNYSVGVLVGAGAVTTGSWTGTRNKLEDEEPFTAERQDALFVVQPELGVHLNITRWLRTGATVGYRLVSGVDTKGLSAQDMNGIVAGGQIQAGWF